MSRLLATISLFVVMGLATGADLLSPSAFTKEYVKVARAKLPEVSFKIKTDLEIDTNGPGDLESKVYLDNAYTAYQASPGDLPTILNRYIASLAELKQDKRIIDRTRIVAIVKDRGWLDDVIASTQKQSAKGGKAEYVAEKLNDELMLVYAEDTEVNIRYLIPKNLEELKITRSELRSLAIQNLENVVPEVRIDGESPLYMIVADGTYEASLLLDPSLWTSGQLKVAGEIVVAVPARDLLLVTGSRNAPELAKVRTLANKFAGESNYRLTNKLFVYRDGKFEVFKER